MRMYDLILKKREGGTLTDREIRSIVTGYTVGDIPEEQMAALLMAVCFQGLDERETVALTLAMAESGEQIDLSRFGNRTADKHSTGGVGDKTTLIAAPIAAACGVIVAKMSGRGLGHTGGTIDKLESIPGFQTELSPETFFRVVEETGLAVVGQSGDLAPADKKIYALRDLTATVENPSLIASSIMSKKLAAGAKNIVLDVKVGTGAFMKTIEDARSLARAMVAIGKNAGRSMAALLTNMDRPLGHCIGNALEVREAVAVLQGKGPADLTKAALALSTQMIALACQVSEQQAAAMAKEKLANGSAFHKLLEMTAAQGGDISYLEHPEQFPAAPVTLPVYAAADGFVAKLDARQAGLAAVHLGAGRSEKGGAIDHSAGIYLHKKPGDAVQKGDLLAELFTGIDACPQAVRLMQESYQIASEQPRPEPLIYEVIR